MNHLSRQVEIVVSNEGAVFYTVLSGVFVFVISQFIQRFVLEPIKEYKSVVGRIDYELKYHSNILTNSGLEKDLIGESLRATRKLSCDLEALYKVIPMNWLFVQLNFIPDRKVISEVARSLIRLSNIGGAQGWEAKNYDEIEKIRKLLKINEL